MFVEEDGETYWMEMEYSRKALESYYPGVAYVIDLMFDEVARDSELDMVLAICDRIDCYYEMFERFGGI